MLDWMLMPLERYADFTWRSQRREYWSFVLLYVILFALATLIDHLLGYGFSSTSVRPWGAAASYPYSGPARIVIALALFLPSLAVSIRRLHDTDRSGWWMLVVLLPYIGSIVMIVLLCRKGTRGPNRYGSDPKAPNPSSVRAVF